MDFKPSVRFLGEVNDSMLLTYFIIEVVIVTWELVQNTKMFMLQYSNTLLFGQGKTGIEIWDLRINATAPTGLAGF